MRNSHLFLSFLLGALIASSFAINSFRQASAVQLRVTSPWTLGVGTGASDTNVINSVMVRQHSAILSATVTATSSCPTSSYSTSGSGAQTNALNLPTSSATTNSCQRVMYDYNIDEIPNDATITKVQFTFNVTAVTNGRNCDFVAMLDSGKEPFFDTAAEIWGNITSGTAYVSNDNSCTTTGVHTLDLGSQAVTDFQSHLGTHLGTRTVNWFAMGIKFNSETRDSQTHTVTLASSDEPSGQRPVFVVTFTSPSMTYIIGGDTTDITDDGAVVTNSASGSTCPNTSWSVSNTTATAVVLKSGSGSNAACQRLFFTWTVAPINTATTTVNYAIAQLGVSAVSSAVNCDVNSIAKRPSTETAANLWTDIGSGDNYFSNDAACASVANYDFNLPSKANTDLQGNITNGWYALGIKFNSETRDASTHSSTFVMSESSSTTTTKARLIVNYAINIGLSQSVTNADAVTRGVANTRTGSVTTTNSDGVSRQLAASRSPSDSSTDSDSVNRNQTVSRTDGDTATTSDSVARQYGAMRSDGDATTLADAIVRAFTGSRAPNDSTINADGLDRAVANSRAQFDNSNNSDSLGRNQTLGRIDGDSVTSSDGLGRSVGNTRTASDSSSIADSIIRSEGVTRLVSDVTNNVDSVLRNVNMTRTIGDTENFLDQIARKINGAIVHTITIQDDCLVIVDQKTGLCI